MRYVHDRRSSRRRNREFIKKLALGTACVIIVGGLVGGAVYLGRHGIGSRGQEAESSLAVSHSAGSSGSPEDTAGTIEGDTIILTSPAEPLLNEATRLAAGYDYDAAIELLKSDLTLQEDPEIQQAISGYEAFKETLVRADINKITHVFFHSLVIDNSKAFDGDRREAGYNQVMTTKNEFLKILESMYEKGFVLVRLHDMSYETTDENGKTVMKAGDIMLPPGKIPFVMSQDDVCYYPYMDGDGFASRIIVGEDGKPATEMIMDDGSVSAGPYDLVPILEDFIQEHPDFSYKGARAVLAFTGYEGILGYRTTESYKDSPTFEQDKVEAAKVAQCLRDNGWELASHSWGHLDLGTVDYQRFKNDSDKWKEEVESLIGPTDIILYPFGGEIGDWRPYTAENQRFNYLYSLGFRYFCGVDSRQYWVQLNGTYLRQGRRNLDGYRMWKDISEPDPSKRKLDDLFVTEDVFDKDRPTPVPEM